VNVCAGCKRGHILIEVIWYGINKIYIGRTPVIMLINSWHLHFWLREEKVQMFVKSIVLTRVWVRSRG